MLRPFLSILLRTAFCAVAVFYAFKVWGAFAIVFGAPLLGVLLARPIIDLIAEGHWAGKSAALESVQGKWWMYRGHRIDVAHDIANARWLLASDVRKVVRELPRDEVLGKQFGERAGSVESFDGFRIRADALAEYLVKSHDASTVRFKVWLDRVVMGGSHNPRAR
ncbi:MAG TPA: hypothetical protein VMZ74_01490 [Ramlibacter sp.]|nr:hypothetical protein [Ramlibacter sp.]